METKTIGEFQRSLERTPSVAIPITLPEDIIPLTKEEARAYFLKLYEDCPHFLELPLPRFMEDEHPEIAEERDRKPGSLKFMIETFDFYDSIKDLPEEEQKAKIKERQDSLNIQTLRDRKKEAKILNSRFSNLLTDK